jgi:hypothetical protein
MEKMTVTQLIKPRLLTRSLCDIPHMVNGAARYGKSRVEPAVRLRRDARAGLISHGRRGVRKDLEPNGMKIIRRACRTRASAFVYRVNCSMNSLNGALR